MNVEEARRRGSEKRVIDVTVKREARSERRCSVVSVICFVVLFFSEME